MFCVYGRSLEVAKKAIDKKVADRKSDISVKLREMEEHSQTEKQEYVDQQVQKYFADMKPKRCTHEFSTPHIAREAYAMMKKDPVNFGDLVIMKKQPRLNKQGNKLVSKSTGKTLMEWVPLSQVVEVKDAA